MKSKIHVLKIVTTFQVESEIYRKVIVRAALSLRCAAHEVTDP